MNRWFRLYESTLDDPKVQLLPDPLFKVWINLLCVASRNDGSRTDGVLPPLDEIAFMLRKDQDAVARHLKDLEKAGLVERTGHKFAIHNWTTRQYASDSSTGRVREHRKRQKPPPNGGGNGGGNGARNVSRNVTRNVSGTANATAPDKTRLDIDKKEGGKPPPSPPGGVIATDDFYDHFWVLYPETEKWSDAAARRAWKRIVGEPIALLDEIRLAINRMRLEWPRQELAYYSPENFLKGERWRTQDFSRRLDKGAGGMVAFARDLYADRDREHGNGQRRRYRLRIAAG